MSGPRARPRPTRKVRLIRVTITCANASRGLEEPLSATAAVARTWLLVEQPGPWGGKALTASHLDPGLGRDLERRAKGTGVRVALVRRPGPHADSRAPHRVRPRTVIAAHTAPGGSWVRHTTVNDAEELRGLALAALGEGEHGGFGEDWTGDPLALVCTNGKRDRCCAVLGRPLAAELTAMGGAEVWEVTHLGGHRFSPTMLVLPHGYAYGRLDARAAKEVVEAARHGRVTTDRCRGRSAWERPGQAAELAVRELTGEEAADALTVESVTETASGSTGGPAPGTADGPADSVPGLGWTVLVRHTDGHAWSVTVTGEQQVPARPESCGAAPGTPVRISAAAVTRAR